MYALIIAIYTTPLYPIFIIIQNYKTVDFSYIFIVLSIEYIKKHHVITCNNTVFGTVKNFV